MRKLAAGLPPLSARTRSLPVGGSRSSTGSVGGAAGSKATPLSLEPTRSARTCHTGFGGVAASGARPRPQRQRRLENTDPVASLSVVQRLCRCGIVARPFASVKASATSLTDSAVSLLAASRAASPTGNSAHGSPRSSTTRTVMATSGTSSTR